MAFSRLTEDLDIIAKLHDDPNVTDALSANQLKAKFDEGPKTIKQWINATFLAALEALTAAANIGAKLTGFSNITTVQQALDKVQEIAEQASQASITDGSITNAKLASADPTADPPVPAAVSTAKIQDGAVTHAKLATVDANGENGAVGTDNINDGAITSAKLAAQAISGTAITDSSITAAKLATDAVETAKIKDANVTAAKLANNAASTVYSGTLAAASWTGSAAPYTQDVTISGVLATDEPIIDLVPSSTYATAMTEADEWANIYRAVTSANAITFYAKAKPTGALNFKARCIRK